MASVLSLPLCLSVSLGAFVVPASSQSASSQGITRSSKRLEPERTAAVVEVAAPAQLAELGKDLPHLQLLENPAVHDFFERVAAQDKASWMIWRRLPQLASRLAKFDGGMTYALVVDPEEEGGNQQAHYLVSTKQRDKLRGLASLLHSYLPKSKIRDDVFSVPDTPITVRVATKKKLDFGWRPRFVSSVVGPRHAGFQATSVYLRATQRGAEAGAQLRERLAQRLARSIGIASRGRGVALGDWILPEGATLLGRASAFFRTPLKSLNFGQSADRVHKRIAAFGMRDFAGARALLIAQDGKLRERWDIYRNGVAEPSWIRALQPDPDDSLGRVAGSLPASTLAAIHLGVAPRELDAWFDLFVAEMGFMAPVFEKIRTVLSPVAKRDGESLAATDSITLAALSPVGTAIPELAMVQRRPVAKDHDGKAEVEALAKKHLEMLFSETPAADRAKVKIRVRGGETPHAFFRFPAPSRNGIGLSATGMNVMLGGGYLTVMRVGDYIVHGFNPRTMRKFGKDVIDGNTLAKRDKLLDRFPVTAKRAFEAWVDWPAVAKVSKSFEGPLQLGFVAFATAGPQVKRIAVPGAGVDEVEEVVEEEEEDPRDTPPQKAIKLPSIARLLNGFGQEYFYSEPADYGLVVHHEGCLALSPVAISAIAAFGSFVDHLHPFFVDY